MLLIQLYETKAATRMLLAVNTTHSIALQKGNRISITNIPGGKIIQREG
jgi:hypothetical protein